MFYRYTLFRAIRAPKVNAVKWAPEVFEVRAADVEMTV